MENFAEKSKKTEKDLLRLPSIAIDRSTADPYKTKEDLSADKSPDPLKSRYLEYHNLIQNSILNLNSDIDVVLLRHEQDFLNAFKSQMYNLYTQIKELKKAANNTGANLKHNEEVQKLRKSIEKAESESVKLSKLCDELQEKVLKLEEKNNSLQEDCKFFKQKYKNVKRQLKKLQIKENSENIHQTLITSIETHSPSPQSPKKFCPSSKSGILISELLSKYKRTDNQLFKEIEEIMEKQSKHFAESTKHYQSIIAKERKKMQNLSVMQSSVFLEKSDLENLFLECVESVKKEMGHRRAKSFREQKFTTKSKNVPIEKGDIFSSGDKRKIMELLISNEQVLIMLYERLFPFRASHFGDRAQNETLTSGDQSNPDIIELMKSLPTSVVPESSLSFR